MSQAAASKLIYEANGTLRHDSPMKTAFCMKCRACGGGPVWRNGLSPAGRQRLRCGACGASWQARQPWKGRGHGAQTVRLVDAGLVAGRGRAEVARGAGVGQRWVFARAALLRAQAELERARAQALWGARVQGVPG